MTRAVPRHPGEGWDLPASGKVDSSLRWNDGDFLLRAKDAKARRAGAAVAALIALATCGEAAAAPAVCARPPMLVRSEDFADPRRLFALRTDGFRATQVSFAMAYQRACAQALLPGGGLGDRLFLRNAPDANVASLYRDGGRLVLEYPFLTGDGIAHVPGTDELAEAIFCHVRGASDEEAEESGRCLPD